MKAMKKGGAQGFIIYGWSSKKGGTRRFVKVRDTESWDRKHLKDQRRMGESLSAPKRKEQDKRSSINRPFFKKPFPLHEFEGERATRLGNSSRNNQGLKCLQGRDDRKNEKHVLVSWERLGGNM